MIAAAKTVIAALICLAVLSSPVEARKKKEPPQPPPTYDYQGDIRWVYVHHDARSSITYADGSSTTVYCDFDGADSDCSVDSGSTYRVRFDEHDKSGVGESVCCSVADGWPKVEECYESPLYHTVVPLSRTFPKDECDPLKKLRGALPLGDQRDATFHGKGTLTFRYRTVTITYKHDGHSEPGFCVPFEIADRKGQIKQGETCYKHD